jgi:cytochrome oxidase Cu insertion factor (SCO1/SenC/PrrC family)
MGLMQYVYAAWRRVLRWRWLVWVSLGALALSGCGDRAFRQIDLTGADYARGFSLPDVNGDTRTLKDFAGRVVVVFLVLCSALTCVQPPFLSGNKLGKRWAQMASVCRWCL